MSWPIHKRFTKYAFFFFFEVPSKYATSTCGLFCAERRPGRLMRKFCPSFNYTKESKWEVFPRIEGVTKDNFYLSDPTIWQGKHLIAKDQLLLLVHSAFLPSEVPHPSPFMPVQNDIYT